MPSRNCCPLPRRRHARRFVPWPPTTRPGVRTSTTVSLKHAWCSLVDAGSPIESSSQSDLVCCPVFRVILGGFLAGTGSRHTGNLFESLFVREFVHVAFEDDR